MSRRGQRGRPEQASAEGGCDSALLQSILPRPELEERHQLSWQGVPEVAAARLGAFRLGELPLPWRLVWPLHDRLCGADGGPVWGQPRARLGGSASLAERAIAGGATAAQAGRPAGAEYLLGFAGQFWRPWRPLAAPGRRAFVAWSAPRTTQVVWHFQLCCHGRDAAVAAAPLRLRMVLRARSQDAFARRAFARYMWLAGPTSRALRRRLLWALASSCGMPSC